MRAFLSLLGGLALMAVAPTALAVGDEPVTLVEFSFVSERVVRGLERAGQVARGGVDWHQGPVRVTAQATEPFSSSDIGERAAGFAWTVPAGAQARVTASAGYTRLAGLPSGLARDVVELGVEAAWSLPRGLEPSLAHHRDLRREAATTEAAIKYSFPLVTWGTFLDGRVAAGWSHARDWRPGSSATPVRGGYGYWVAEWWIPYRIGARTTVVAGLHASGTRNARDEGLLPGARGRRNLAASLGLTLDF